MSHVGAKFGDYIKEGFDLYKENWVVVLVSTLIALLIATFSFGILAGPMIAGVIKIVLRLKDGDQTPPAIGDVFQGFQYFVPSFLFCLVWGLILMVASFILALIPCLGQLIQLALSFTASALLMYGLYLIVDRGMDFWTASMTSIEKVKTEFFPFLGLAVVATLISVCGTIACIIGVFVTAPLQYTIIGVSYRDVFGDGDGQAPPAPPEKEIPAPEPAPPEAPEAPKPSDEEKE